MPMSIESRTRTRTRSVMSAPMRSVLGGSVLGDDDLDGGIGTGVLAAPVLGYDRFWVDWYLSLSGNGLK